MTYDLYRNIESCNRLCVEIMKNHPDPAIREYVYKELLRGK